MNLKSTCIAASAFLAICGLGLAVQPANFDHSSEGDFGPAELDNTAVNSLGEVTLSRKLSVLLPSTAGGPATASSVAPCARGAIFAGSGNEPLVYKVGDGKALKLAELPGAMICCMVAQDDGHLDARGREDGKLNPVFIEKLLVGTGGDKAGLFEIAVRDGMPEVEPGGTFVADPTLHGDKGKFAKIWSDEKAKYIWAVLPDGEGGYFAATGPNATIYRVDSKGKGEAIFAAPADLAKNFTCLARSKKGLLYAGTDKSGLVFEIDPAAKTGRVILDAEESEISSIVVDPDGTVYAATSDESKAVAEEGAPSGEEGGHPEGGISPAASKPAGATSAPADNAAHHTPAGKSAPASHPSASPAEKSGTTETHGASAHAAESGTGILPVGSSVRGERSGAEETHGRDAHATSADEQPSEGDGQPSGDSSDGPAAELVARIAGLHAMPPREIHGEKSEGGAGNAVYRISPDGLVQTIFRKPVTILAMIGDGEDLVLATGNGGEIYRISKDGETTVRMAAADAKQVTALARGDGPHGGDIYFATANKASVGKMEPALAASGTITSKPQDAKQVAKWGAIGVRAQLPQGTKVLVSTRSGNLAEASDKTWSQWSPEKELSDSLRVQSPAARFIQYRLKLVAAGDKTPVVRQVELFYQVANLPPVIQAVTVSSGKADAGAGPGPSGPQVRGPMPMPMPKSGAGTDQAGGSATRMVQIKATDPNDDQLIYSVFFRQAGTDDPWVKIADKLKEPQYAWDTKTVADGTYEIKVVASDSPSNPPATALETSRVSSPVIVDNTPPEIITAKSYEMNRASQAVDEHKRADEVHEIVCLAKGLDAEVKGTAAAISGVAIDANRISAIHYSVDSQDEWVTVLPTSGICDSPKEEFTFTVKDLKPGPHRIAVRATDQFGNMGYASVSVTIGK
jgi:hypothetical protein